MLSFYDKIIFWSNYFVFFNPQNHNCLLWRISIIKNILFLDPYFNRLSIGGGGITDFFVLNFTDYLIPGLNFTDY